MTPSEKELVREFLTKVVEGDLSVVKDKRLGACCNFMLFNSDSRSIARLMTNANLDDWPHYSGMPPVPITPYNGIVDKWQGEQLRLRQSLCAHLLTKLEE